MPPTVTVRSGARGSWPSCRMNRWRVTTCHLATFVARDVRPAFNVWRDHTTCQRIRPRSTPTVSVKLPACGRCDNCAATMEALRPSLYSGPYERRHRKCPNHQTAVLAGLSLEDAAQAVGISRATAQRKWATPGPGCSGNCMADPSSDRSEKSLSSPGLRLRIVGWNPILPGGAACPSPVAESIFGQAIEIQADEDRAAFLDKACGNNQQLRAEVETLVADPHGSRESAASPPQPPQRSGPGYSSAVPSQHPPVGCRHHAPARWLAGSGQASPGPASRPQVSSVHRTQAATASAAPWITILNL